MNAGVPPNAAPSASAASAPADQRLTPAMRQHARFKAQHPECILLFRMGDFYELFGEDAVTAHKALGLTLTQRNNIQMAGVPYHALDSYLRRLIEQGFRVAVCDQIQDPKDAVGVVDRAVTRVVTPGTLIDDSLLDAGAPNCVAAIQFTGIGDDSAAALACVELSTGSFLLLTIPAGQAIDELARLSPSELIFAEPADGAVPARVSRLRDACSAALTPRSAWTFRQQDASEILHKHFGVRTLGGFGLTEHDPAIGPAGALLRYLYDTQCPDDGSRDRLRHLRPPARHAAERFMQLDASTLRSLEIERTMRHGETDGSLISVVQRCVTPMGRRTLRSWLLYPLTQRNEIERRLEAVQAFVNDRALANALTERLNRMHDMPRLASRLAMRRGSPRDLVALGQSARALAPIATLLAEHPALKERSTRLAELAQCVETVAHAIVERCVDSPPSHLRDGGLFRDGVDAELDEARSLERDQGAWLNSYQEKLVAEIDIPSLKIGYNKVFGYHIEITNTHREKVPPTLRRTQTLKNAERYVTAELSEFEQKVTTARARALDREQRLFEQLCSTVDSIVSEVSAASELIAELDVLAGFADLAVRRKYVRPVLVDEPALHIVQGRHPVLDQALTSSFVPNDCLLGKVKKEMEPRESPESAPLSDDAATPSSSGGATLALITGPNMAGKSTYIRQVALIVLLAQAGCFVPAEQAVIGIADRIFTRIGAWDELHAGQSTFMVEMIETANILHHATPSSLVILDEIGRGTSTLDGLSLAWAIAETLAARKCRTLFATHYHELTTLADQLPEVTNLHVAVREWGSPGHEEIIFLHRILPGRTDRSYGIHVARIAGVPRHTIERARTLLDSLAVQTEHIDPRRLSAGSQASSRPAQMSLFTEYVDHPAIESLRGLDLDSMSPLQAFDALRKLRDLLDT